MAAPSYTTDLTVISACDSNTTPLVFTNVGTGADATETDYYIQGSACVSKPFNITAGGIYVDNTAGITFTSGQCFWAWYYFGCPNALLTEASGGLQALIGSSSGNYNFWNVLGSDTYTYGGWRCIPIDPVNITADASLGTPTSTRQLFGVYCRTSAGIGKGNPLGIDVMRYGRGEARVNGGDLANGYATFTGYAGVNDTGSARYGLIQAIDGGFLVQGLVILGYTSAVDFRDSNKVITIANTKKVQSTFNTFEIRQSTSRIDWTNISITALGTVSRGDFVTTDDADVNITSSTFTDMGTFGFKSVGTILTSTFRRCGLITQSSAVFTGCIFDSTNDSVKAMLSNDPSKISGCSFISSGTKHAIELTTACAGNSYAFDSNNFTGYATTNGTTGNEVIYNNSGGAVTLNVTTSGTGTISVRNGTGASTTVSSSASLVITIVDADGIAVNGTEVTVVDDGDGTELHHEDLVGNTTTYSYSTGANTVYVNVLKSAGSPYYQPKTVNNVSLPASGSTSLLVQLDVDRFYSNP